MARSTVTHKQLGEMILALLSRPDEGNIPDFEQDFRNAWSWGQDREEVTNTIEFELIDGFNYALVVEVKSSCEYTVNKHDEGDVGLGGVGELDGIENIEHEILGLTFFIDGNEEINFSGNRDIKDEIINILTATL